MFSNLSALKNVFEKFRSRWTIYPYTVAFLNLSGVVWTGLNIKSGRHCYQREVLFQLLVVRNVEEKKTDVYDNDNSRNKLTKSFSCHNRDTTVLKA